MIPSGLFIIPFTGFGGNLSYGIYFINGRYNRMRFTHIRDQYHLDKREVSSVELLRTYTIKNSINGIDMSSPISFALSKVFIDHASCYGGFLKLEGYVTL